MSSLTNHHVLITAGPTIEMIDPVRFLSNRSSGRLGYALAAAAQRRGARVTLISGPTHVPVPRGVTLVPVQSALDMQRACRRHAPRAQLIIMTAAVADFRAQKISAHKIKKGTRRTLQLRLVRTPDLLAELCRRRRANQFIAGFALESRALLAAAQKKIRSKGCDVIVANTPDAINAITQRVTLLWPDGTHETLPALTKPQLARALLDRFYGRVVPETI